MKKIITVVVIVLVGFVIYLAYQDRQNTPTDETENKNTEVMDSGMKLPPKSVIVMTDDGYVPSEITIHQGDTVTFLNETDNPSWPASDIHPTHGAYPEGGGCINSALDACKGLEKGEQFTFTFNKLGTWKLHDHLAPRERATITVIEVMPAQPDENAGGENEPGEVMVEEDGDAMMDKEEGDAMMEEGETHTFNINAQNFSFSETVLRVKKGDKVRIILTNSGGLHDWVMDKFNAGTERINEGDTATVEFIADETGTFEFYCSVGNHRAQGMVGNLIVEE